MSYDRRALMLLAFLEAGSRLAAQETPDVPGAGHPTIQRQVDYTGLWPFYSREVFEGGRTRTSVLAGLMRTTTGPQGEYHHHLLPFYDVSVADAGRDRRLAIFPLLYFSRRSPEISYDHVLPLFSRWRAGASTHVLSWPLFHVARNPEETPYFFIPTLLRLGVREHRSDQRLGVPFVFSAFEHASEARSSTWAIGNFFNWGETAELGLALGKLARQDSGAWRSHLFPLFAAGREGRSWYTHTPLLGLWRNEEGAGDGSRGLVVPPLLFLAYAGGDEDFTAGQFPTFLRSRRRGGDVLFILPFYLNRRVRSPPSSMTFYSLLYGRTENAGRESSFHWFPLLLTRVGRVENRPDVDVLWPLGHYARHPDGYSLRVLPILDRRVRGPEKEIGVGGILFRRFADTALGVRSTWAPMPLVHWKTSPEGLLAWAIPAFYHERWNERESRGHASFGFPTFYSRADEAWLEDGGWTMASRSLHVWPLFGFEASNEFESVEIGEEPVEAPSGEPSGVPPEDSGARSVLKRRSSGPGYDSRSYGALLPFLRVDRRGRDADPDGVETGVHAPWPLVLYRRDRRSAEARVWPLLFTGARPERAHFRLYPAVSVETGTQAENDFWTGTSVVQWHRGVSERFLRVFPLIFEWYAAPDTQGTDAAGDPVTRRRVAGPLYWFLYSGSSREGWFHLAPLGFGSWSETGSSVGVFPFFYRRRFADDLDYWTAGRFFFLWNSLESERESHRSFLWKLVDWTSTPEGDFDFRILHRFVVNRAVGGQREFTLNPFFTIFRDDDTGTRRLSIFKFVYRSDVADGVETRRLFFIPFWKGEADE